MGSEVFKDIPQYEGLYQVSNLGNVKSLNYGKTKTEKILKIHSGSYGYLRVALSKNKKSTGFGVHQLVAMAFLNHTPCGYSYIINHKNFIRSDNRLENLEVVTSRENCNKKHLKSTSEFVGVCWGNRNKKWIASIMFNGKHKHLGYFDTEEGAKDCYENALQSIKNGTEIQSIKKSVTSKYKGVSRIKISGKWKSQIKINGVNIYLGCFETEEEASEAYQNYKNNTPTSVPAR